MKIKCNNCGFKTEAENCIICPDCGHIAKPYTEKKTKKKESNKEVVEEQIELQKLTD